MTSGFIPLILTLATSLLTGANPPEKAEGPEDGVVVVEMVETSATSFAFRPSEVEVPKGATLRFVQAGAVPHNVEFKSSPDGARIDDIRMGPFLLTRGETYEIVLDERFPAGSYGFVCTPHEAMGMVGTLTVTPGS